MLESCVFIFVCLKVFSDFLFDFFINPLVLFGSMLFSLRVFVFFPFFFLELLSSFILFWLEKKRLI